MAEAGGTLSAVQVEHKVGRIAKTDSFVVDPTRGVLVLDPYFEFLRHPFTNVRLRVIDPDKLKALDPLEAFFWGTGLFTLQCQECIDWHLYGRD